MNWEAADPLPGEFVLLGLEDPDPREQADALLSAAAFGTRAEFLNAVDKEFLKRRVTTLLASKDVPAYEQVHVPVTCIEPDVIDPFASGEEYRT